MTSADCEAAVGDWHVRGPLQCWGRARHQLRHVSPGAAATCLPPWIILGPCLGRAGAAAARGGWAWLHRALAAQQDLHLRGRGREEGGLPPLPGGC